MRAIAIILTLYCATLCAQSGSNYSIYGVFNAYETQYFDTSNTSLVKNKSVSAYFSQSSSPQILLPSRDSAGVIKFDDQSLSYNNTFKFYANNDLDVTNTLVKWEVSGNGSIPAMNFEYNGVMPSFDVSDTLIIDTLIKTDTMVFIRLSNLSNADSVSIEMYDDSLGTILHRVIMLAPNFTDTYYIPAQVFQTLKAGLRAIIKVEAINYTYQTISDKQFLFRNTFAFARYRIPIVASGP